MDPNDKEWKEQLARDPFVRGGFDQRLRQRIKDRIEEEERGGLRRPQRAAWRMPAAALASFAVILLGIWLWNGPLDHGQNPEDIMEPSPQKIAATPSVSAPDQPNKYAVLIGLREDHKDKDTPTSTYRTVLVAPVSDPERLSLITDTSGLYMPYKQDFWNIATVSSADGRQALQAIQATNRKTKKADKKVHVPDYVLSERVVYAGNEYLSIQSKVKDGNGGSAENWWIKHIGQINTKPDDPREEPHTVLPDVIPGMDRKQQGYVDQWRIYRDPGQWVSELYFSSTGDSKKLQVIPSTIVQHDQLLMSWEDIQKIEPGARDAFTYGNVLGVVTEGEIRIHAIRDGSPVGDAVRFSVGKDESIIMIQWAQSGGRIDYVDKWINDMRALLGKQP